MGNVLSPVSGTIIVVDATGEDTNPGRRSGPRFPRPRLQRLETTRPTRSDTNPRLAEGTLPPPSSMPTGEIDFEEAITEVNTPAPPKPAERPTTAS